MGCENVRPFYSYNSGGLNNDKGMVIVLFARNSSFIQVREVRAYTKNGGKREKLTPRNSFEVSLLFSILILHHF